MIVPSKNVMASKYYPLKTDIDVPVDFDNTWIGVRAGDTSQPFISVILNQLGLIQKN